MDASFSLTRLIEEVEALLAGADFEGAEAVLCGCLGREPRYEHFVHFQLGRMYARWNKLSSSLNHLSRAAELAHTLGDEILGVQIAAELSAVRRAQKEQKP